MSTRSQKNKDPKSPAPSYAAAAKGAPATEMQEESKASDSRMSSQMTFDHEELPELDIALGPAINLLTPSTSLPVEKLTFPSRSYIVWAVTMEFTLRDAGVFDVIINDLPATATARQANAWRQREIRAARTIFGCLDRSVQARVMACQGGVIMMPAKRMWEEIKKLFNDHTVLQRHTIMRKVGEVRCSDVAKAGDAVAEIDILLTDYMLAGGTITDDDRLLKYLDAMPPPLVLLLETACTLTRYFRSPT